MKKKISISLIALVSAVLASMADITDLPVKNLDGKSFYYYEVQPKETVYSICRRLNITKEELFAANPSVASDGLKANSTLYFPMVGTEASPETHLVKKGETIYGICHTYGITPAQLEAWNPNVREGLKTGMTIYLSDPSSQGISAREMSEGIRTEVKNEIAVQNQVQNSQPSALQEVSGESGRDCSYISYKVKEKETFYSIAHSHNISVAELEAANPGTGILKAGQILMIPLAGTSVASGTPVTSSTEAIRITVPGAVETITAQQVSDTIIAEEKQVKSGINIAVLLPFMAEETPQPRQGQLYTEFYKGLLLAVDSMRHCGTPISVTAFDTGSNSTSLEAVLSDPRLRDARLIIAPENESQLEKIAEFGDANDISVLNLFAIKSQSHLNHPSVFQANIPHVEMYKRAVEGIVKDMDDRTPVIITSTDGEGDKTEFVNQLKRAFSKAGINYQTISYNTALSINDLSSLDTSKKYAFIPASGKQTDLNRMLPAMIEFRQSLVGSDPVRLYGYPEWTTFRGETLENMHAVNTYVYSRFFTVPDDPWASEVQSSFEKWYGVPMGNFVPRQGLLGFDTGMYIIGALRNDYPVTTYNGVQNGFHFIRPDGDRGGHVNTELYFVNFRPSGLIDRIEL